MGGLTNLCGIKQVEDRVIIFTQAILFWGSYIMYFFPSENQSINCFCKTIFSNQQSEIAKKVIFLRFYRSHFFTCFWKQLCARAKSNKQNLIVRNCLSKWFSSANCQIRSLWITCSWHINDTSYLWQIRLFFYIFVKQHIVTYCVSTFLNVNF
jgi:hypothetical protein